MTTDTITLPRTVQKEFNTEQVLQISGAHFVHDTFTGFIPTFLPVLIEKLSLSLSSVGTLTAIMQVPAILNPMIGYLADRASLQLLVILAPAVTATLVCLIGIAPSVPALAILLFAIGVSVACFHAPAPAMIGQISGRKIGLGMSLFMACGEMARTVGPILAAFAVSAWTLEGTYRMMAIGWLISFVLFWRMRHISARARRIGSLSELVPSLRSLFLPLIVANFFRLFMFVCLTTYLPTLLETEGASLWRAGGSLSILELAGVAGALSSGTVSDLLGRKTVLVATTLSSTLMMFIFLRTSGWWVIPVLLVLGFTTLSTTPVMLAMVQDQLPNHRAVGNGLFMVMTFLLNALVSLMIGFFGDRIGLRGIYSWSILLSLASVPAFLALPGSPPKTGIATSKSPLEG
jgi:FSR family fosmidomycin resistance protein-like MFS transporter